MARKNAGRAPIAIKCHQKIGKLVNMRRNMNENWKKHEEAINFKGLNQLHLKT